MKPTLQPASWKKRLFHLVFDYSFFMLLLLAVYWLAPREYRFFNRNFHYWTHSDPSVVREFDFTMDLIFALVYFTLQEYILGGRTLGKLITRTKVVRVDCTPLTFRAILIRNLIRLIPLEPFSFFINKKSPWHDEWSETIVINQKTN
jgi:uncharacterized RDD family membrane protein YckC